VLLAGSVAYQFAGRHWPCPPPQTTPRPRHLAPAPDGRAPWCRAPGRKPL